MNTKCQSLSSLETLLLSHQCDIESWFRKQWGKTPPPFYGSVDIRNAGFKIAPVDTNLFPAGFNNLTPHFIPLAIQAVQSAISEICPETEKILIIPENHTRNFFYFENLAMLQEILMQAGFEVRIGSFREDLKEKETYQLDSGRSIAIEPLKRKGDKVGVKDFYTCLIVLNNDLSDGIPDILKNVSQKIMPSVHLGWFNRLKSEHFRFYGEIVEEFAQKFSFDSWLLNPLFEYCHDVNFSDKKGLDCLAANAEDLLFKIQQKYDKYEIKEKPFLVIKADAGTYGMAVMMIKDPDELYALNRKQRNKMAKGKGGQQVTKAIIQEGVHSIEVIGENKTTAEPVLYLMGRNLIGGFYRAHESKGSDENLNSPGMHFHPFEFAQTCLSPHCCSKKKENRFYAHGIVARLAFLAAARELTNLRKAQ